MKVRTRATCSRKQIGAITSGVELKTDKLLSLLWGWVCVCVCMGGLSVFLYAKRKPSTVQTTKFRNLTCTHQVGANGAFVVLSVWMHPDLRTVTVGHNRFPPLSHYTYGIAENILRQRVRPCPGYI